MNRATQAGASIAVGCGLALVLLSPVTDGIAARTGSDAKATSLVTELHDGYRPWRRPVLRPEPAMERRLFACQAGTGAALLAFVLLGRRKPGRSGHASR